MFTCEVALERSETVVGFALDFALQQAMKAQVGECKCNSTV